MKITYKKDKEVVTVEIPTPDGMTTIERKWFIDTLQANNIDLDWVVEISGLPESLTLIDSVVFNSRSLAAITLPDGVTSISSSAFHGCGRLTGIKFREKLSDIGESAFYGCHSFSTITLDGVTSIGKRAFSFCTKLTGIILLASPRHIDTSAFDGCRALQYILAPESPIIDIDRFCISVPINENNMDPVGIPATAKFIRYDASAVRANPIAAVRALYQRIITECGYTDPEKKKQVQQHLEESFLKPEQLLKSALKSLYPLRTTQSTIKLMDTIREYLIEGCRILKGEIPSRTLDHANAQNALSQLISVLVPHSVATDLFKSCVLPHLSNGFRILMDPTLTSPFADQPSLPKKANPIDQGPGSGGGADGNTLTP